MSRNCLRLHHFLHTRINISISYFLSCLIIAANCVANSSYKSRAGGPECLCLNLLPSMQIKSLYLGIMFDTNFVGRKALSSAVLYCVV